MSRSSRLSSVSENGAGGDEGGSEDSDARRVALGRGVAVETAPGRREGERWRLEPLGVDAGGEDCVNC